MKERELVPLVKNGCALCGKKIGQTPIPLFYRVTVERFGLEDRRAREGEPMNPCHVISLGAGVQSSTLALLAAAGTVGPMPEAAIFADTLAEPAAVYTWLDRLEAMLPFPVVRVSAGNLGELSTEIRVAKNGDLRLGPSIPAHMKARVGPGGILQRQCTREFKVRPIARAARELAGKGRPIVQWIGISIDEAHRMKPSRTKKTTNRYSLVELRFDRDRCRAWLRDRGLEAPRSACVFCPFHSDKEWKRLTPAEIASAAEYERKLQAGFAATRRIRSIPFLHPSRIPIDQVRFESQKELWGNECEGHCGV